MHLVVSDVSRLAHVSVRTLHHYDAIGLLEPSARSEAGYRLYTHADLERLQQVLFYKELGFGLSEIRSMMTDTAFDRAAALREQRDLVAARARRYQAMLDLIDTTLAHEETGVAMRHEEMFEVFGEFDPRQYAAEVEERWGGTDAYAESKRRTARYGAADWRRFKAESEELNGAVVRLMDDGVAPTDARAMDAAEALRRQIDAWFYPCSREMHASLGEMYVQDPRFTATYEAIRAGMARYLRDAIAANAAR